MAQYEHRKLMMKVNQQLGSEEFDSLVYLMCVPDEIVDTTQSGHDRTRVLRHLEKQNIIGPHNYHCLVDALDTLGRCDLIMQIASADPEGVVAKLPYTPQSIQPQQLAWLAKQASILNRKEKYIGYMKDFLHSGPENEENFGDKFSRVLSTLALEQDQFLPQCQESVAATLTELSLLWKRWPISFAIFQHNGDSSKVKTLMHDCHYCFDHFNRELPPTWEMEVREYATLFRVKAQHPFGQRAWDAHSALHELSAELIGEQPLKEAKKRAQEAFLALESIRYIVEYVIPIYKWLMTLVQSTALSATDVSKMYVVLKAILSDHSEDIATNRDILVGIVGKEAMHRISQELLQEKRDEDSDSKYDIDIPTHTSLVRSVSVVWHVALIMLVLMSLNYEVDHRAIQHKLAGFFLNQKRILMHVYFNLSKKFTEGMKKTVDGYKEICEQKINKLVGGSPETLELVQSLFSYNTD